MICRPFAFMLTGGNAADSPAAHLLADKGYDANSLRKHLRQSHIGGKRFDNDDLLKTDIHKGTFGVGCSGMP